MSTYSLSHLSDPVLLRTLAVLVTRDRATTAALLAHLAEVDARKLYLPAAYPSMFAYCVGELHMSEDSAFKRIRAARAARRFPAIYMAVADGRLNLSVVVLLAPHLTEETADELQAAAVHKTKLEVEEFVATRFPRPEVPTRLEAIEPPLSSSTFRQLAPGPVATIAAGPSDGSSAGLLAPVEAPAPIEPPVRRPGVTPPAPERFALQVTITQSTHDKLRYAQALLGHQIASSDIAGVLDRALDALIHGLERRKFAATARPRRDQRRAAASPRHIPAHVRRAVWERDGGQCTFVSEAGHRCPARSRLEFDHVLEVARGGEATVAGVRLRCRAHNQYQAERTFGAEFMNDRRERARQVAAARATARARTGAGAQAEAAASEDVQERDVAPWLRQLGFRADEVGRATALCATIPDASLEDRVRLALSSLARGGPRRVRVVPLGSTPRSSAPAPAGRCPAPGPPSPP